MGRHLYFGAFSKCSKPQARSTPVVARKIRLRGDQQGSCAVARVEMLEDDAVGFDWKLEQIPIFPIVALLVDTRVSGALDHNENHAALAAKGEIGRSPNFRTRKPESYGSNRSLWNGKG